MNTENRYQPPQAEVADVHVGGEAELGDRGSRLGAAIIDGLLQGALIVPLMFMNGYWDRAMRGEAGFSDQLIFVPLGLVAFLVLQGYLLHTSGQTIGKRLVGLRIVSNDENRTLPLWRIVVLRVLPIQLGGIIPVVGPILGLVDSLFIFKSDRRCLHDLIAGTRVVKATASWERG